MTMRKAMAVSRLTFSSNCRRSLFTNADAVKRQDPYAQLGLTWGATTTEIKEAYRKKAREYHPDVVQQQRQQQHGEEKKNPQDALRKFQQIQSAYEKLINRNDAHHSHRDDLREEWSFRVWRKGDIIAQERTDVAGVRKKRPVQPAVSRKSPSWGGVAAALGHPSGRGISLTRGEYLTSGGGSSSLPPKSSTVGTGRSKWVTTPKELRPWNPEQSKQTRASESRPWNAQRRPNKS